MKVIINSQDEGSGEDEIYLGCLEPSSEILMDSRFLNDDGTLMHELVETLWGEWREVNPEPNSDCEFVTWLVEVKGWTVFEEQLFDVVVQW